MSKALELYNAQLEIQRKDYDLNVNPEPKNVTLEKVKYNPETGRFEDVTVKNLAMKKQEVDVLISSGFDKSYTVTNTEDFFAKLNSVPNGGLLQLTLAEDVAWDRDINKYNMSLIINLNGHRIFFREHIVNNNPHLNGIDGSNNSVTLSGGSKEGSQLVLPASSTDVTIQTHGSFLFADNYGWADGNTLTLGYGLEVVDKGDFFLIGTKGGSAFTISGVTLYSSTNREWKDLVYGMKIVNGVAKNFSTNISLT